MAKHEFGIIDEFDESIKYRGCNPEEYGAISLDEDIMELIAGRFVILKTFYQNLDQPGLGLDYCGITLIPPSSLAEFKRILLIEKKFRELDELTDIIDLFGKAIKEEKYIIHFGI